MSELPIDEQLQLLASIRRQEEELAERHGSSISLSCHSSYEGARGAAADRFDPPAGMFCTTVRTKKPLLWDGRVVDGIQRRRTLDPQTGDVLTEAWEIKVEPEGEPERIGGGTWGCDDESSIEVSIELLAMCAPELLRFWNEQIPRAVDQLL